MRVIKDSFPLDESPSWYFSAPYGKALESQSPDSSWLCIASDVGDWLLPLILEPLPGGGFHASSPYGYTGIYVHPGLSTDLVAAHWQSALDTMRGMGVISIFLRFAPFDPHSVSMASALPGLDVRPVSQTRLVHLTDEESMWESLLGRARTAIRKAQREGLTAEVNTIESDTSFRTVGAFRTLYEATMRRVGASESYRYDDDYYDRLTEGSDHMRIITVRDSEALPVASSIVLLDRTIAHYHLSGSDPLGARMGANNLLIWTMMTWSASHGFRALHLGGGTSPDDSLYRFKAGFGGTALPFSIGRTVLDEERYMALTEARARELGVSLEALRESNFFPAYRTRGQSA